MKGRERMKRFWIDIDVAFGYRLISFIFMDQKTRVTVQDVPIFNLGIMLNAGRTLR